MAYFPLKGWIGLVMMWFGLRANVPKGFQECDGTNGTPDLRGYFIRGAGAYEEPDDIVYGSNSHGHGVDSFELEGVNDHNHGNTGDGGSHDHTVSSLSSDNAGDHYHSLSSLYTDDALGCHCHFYEFTTDYENEYDYQDVECWGYNPVCQAIRYHTHSYCGDTAETDLTHYHSLSGGSTDGDGDHYHDFGGGTTDGVGDHQHTTADGGAHSHNLTTFTLYDADNIPEHKRGIYIMYMGN